MYIGYMGDIIFAVSQDYMKTVTDFQRSGEARWAEHDLILRKPVSQFAGPGLEKVSFKILLRADHGVNPRTGLKRLREMRDTGEVFPLISGGRPVTQNYWRLDAVSEGENFYSPDGRLLQTEASVSLTEYDDSNYTEEQSALNKYGTIYNAASALLGGGYGL